MKDNVLLHQRLLSAWAVLFIIIAIVIALGVIPPAKADTYPGVNHETVAKPRSLHAICLDSRIHLCSS